MLNLRNPIANYFNEAKEMAQQLREHAVLQRIKVLNQAVGQLTARNTRLGVVF